ncbi:MAG: tyrosine-type recombinase/integrase [Deltaproteobacteria bacterium]|nr:tyrosine-type recombinase/integrase [Deltaproteobacteria bacterium]
MADLDSILGGAVTPGALGESSLVSTIDSYVRYYASGSSHTARAKRLDLDHFVSFLQKHRSVSKAQKLKVKDWDFSSVQRFVDDCLGKGESPATVARRLATIKHMGRTLAEKVAGFINPGREVKAPKINPPKPKALTAREIKKIQARAKERADSKQSFIRFRNQVIFNFLIDTGLRADEVRLLRFSQLDDKLEWIKNVRTKGRRYRNVYITSAIRPELEAYVKVREEELRKFYSKLTKSENKSLPLFISTYDAVPGEPDSFLMGAKTLWRAVRELSAETKLHPHLLRHSYALDLLNESNDIRLVSQALGHSDVRITMRYTQRVDDEIAGALERSRRKRKDASN